MNLNIGCFYKLVINVNGNTLTYNCKIVEISDNFVTFVDKLNKKLTYNINNIISIEEVENDN